MLCVIEMGNDANASFHGLMNCMEGSGTQSCTERYTLNGQKM